MDREGDCCDDAPEGFLGGLEAGLAHRAAFPAREAARQAILELEEAFRDRRRSALGFSTPTQAHAHTARAA